MRLLQIKDPAEIIAIRQCFTFKAPSNIKVIIHAFEVNNQIIGYIATEDIGTVAGPHMYIIKKYHSSLYIKAAAWICKNVYFPLMRGLGKEFLVTNCDSEDTSTLRFLTEVGFDTRAVTVAEYTL